MRRYREPAALVFLLALMASLAVHLPVYEGLGKLADYFRAVDAARGAGSPGRTVELDFEVLDATETAPSQPTARLEPNAEEGAPSRALAPERRAAERPEPASRRPLPPPEPERAVPVRPEPARPAPPPPSTAARHAITQRSQDPTVEPPPDTRYLAEENSRVEEETIARVTNMVTDDENPVAADPSAAGALEPDREGNAAESRLAEARELEGEESRSATPEEAARERPEESGRVVAEVEGPRHDAARIGGGAGGDATGSEAPAGEAQSAAATARARAARGGGSAAPRATETITVNDGIGTFVVTRPAPTAAGSGEGSGGGPREAGRAGARASAPERRAGAAGAGARSGPPGPGEALSWSQFEQVMGETRLREEREAYVAERRTKIRGNSHQRRFAEFRAALDNNVVGVRPGNQTALNAAASPFANYIAAVHRRIHQEFAGRFLAGLPTFSSSPFSDPSLHTKLEIVINRDGTVHRVSVVDTSGYLPFDYGAFNSVMRAQPYPAAPTAILSGDGRVYLHWTFNRGPSQCGQWNAEPYILPNPPGGPGRSDDGMIDGPEASPLVPEGARPTWGTEEEGGVPGGGSHEHGPPAEGAPPPAGPRAPAPASPPRGEDEETPPRTVPAVPAGAALG